MLCQKMPSDALIEPILRGHGLGDASTEHLERRQRGIVELAKIGGVDLRVAVELPEIGIDQARVEERHQAASQAERHPSARKYPRTRKSTTGPVETSKPKLGSSV